MEREIAKKVFYLEDYCNKENMEEHIKAYIANIKSEYPNATVTKEFYKGSNILVRAILIESIKNNIIQKDKDLEKENVRIRERGINGIGENVDREISHSHGGNERERGGR